MKKLLVVLMAALFMAGLSVMPAKAEDLAPKVKEAMQVLKDKLGALGAAKLESGSLMFGSTEINGNFDIVDEVADAKGCTATVFMKKDDGSFERIATNVIKEGRRAIGTKLADNSPAFEPIKKGESYFGPAEILGSKYETGYEPIKNGSGEVIGIYYVGYKL